MAIYKCKMCGGDLEVLDGVSVIECDFCGTKQTVPTANDEGVQALFNRANTLRTKCEFDKTIQSAYNGFRLKNYTENETKIHINNVHL